MLLQSYQYPNLSDGADRVAGQLRGDKELVPLQWRNYTWQSLEEGAGKRCWECGYGSDGARVEVWRFRHQSRQMRRDKEQLFNGVTNYGRVWSKRAAGKRGVDLECK